jgi:hypothetical protein
VDTQHAHAWVKDQLRKGTSLSTLTQTLRSKYGPGADCLVHDAVYSAEVISSNCLDNCHDRSAKINSYAKLIKNSKCSGCPNNDLIGCKTVQLMFSESGINPLNTDETDEASDVRAFFKDCTINIDIKADSKITPLDIQMENIGREMVVPESAKTDLPNDVAAIYKGTEELKFVTVHSTYVNFPKKTQKT